MIRLPRSDGWANARLHRRPGRYVAFAAAVVASVVGAAGAPSAGASAVVASEPPSPASSAPASGAPDTAAPQSGGTLNFALGNDPISLNPQGGGSGNDTLYVERQLFDSLVDQDPATGEIVPWLAESWEVNDDATSFTFHLRDGVTFSDGTPLTADVVKANFDDIIANGAAANAAAPYLTGYQETTVADPLTLTVTFESPSAPFLQAAASVALGIVAPSSLAVPFDDRATSGLVGSGPFTLDHYTPNSEVVLNRRDGYAWAPADRQNQGDAYVDSVVFSVIPEASVRTGALESGQVQVIGGVPPQDISSITDGGFAIVSRANPGVVFGLSPIVSAPPFDDVDVRRAIGLAIDPAAIRDAVLSPEFAVATSPLASTTPGWVDLSASLVSDPDQAGALLDQAGWTLGDGGIREQDGKQLDLTLGWVANFGPNQAAVELIQAQLLAVGINVTLQSGTVGDFLQSITDGKFNLVWGNLSRADGDVLRTQFSAATGRYGVDDPDLEQLFADELSEGEPGARAATIAQIQQTVLDQGYVAPVFELTTVLGLDPSVHGVTLGADSRLAQLADAWIDAG